MKNNNGIIFLSVFFNNLNSRNRNDFFALMPDNKSRRHAFFQRYRSLLFLGGRHLKCVRIRRVSLFKIRRISLHGLSKFRERARVAIPD